MDQATRLLVYQRAGGRCEYCHLHEADEELVFHVEHIVPQKHGGASKESNLALSCQNCNLHKGPNLSGIDPLTQQLTRLFNPRADEWADNFRYEESRIVGLTAIGRTTVRVLAVNDPDRVELREILGYTDKFG